MSGRFPALLLLLAACACTSASHSSSSPGVEPASLPLSLCYLGEDSCLPIVEARIGDVTGRFVLDTGAGRNAISRRFAQRLGLASRGTVPVELHDGELECPVVDLPPVELGSVRVPEGAAAVLEVLDRTNESSGCRIDGILGRPLFLLGVVRIDAPSGTLTIHESKSQPDWASLDTLALEFHDGLPYVVIDPAGVGAATYLLDTGCAVPLLVKRAHPLFASVTNWADLYKPSGTAGQAAPVLWGRLPSMRIGRAVFENVAIGFDTSERGDPSEAVVGSVMFRDRTLLVDFARHRVGIGPRRFRTGRWGLAVQPHDGGLRVYAVYAGSPADLAGVREGDYVRVKGGGHEPDSVSGFHEVLAGRAMVELEFGRGDTVREAKLESAASMPEVRFQRKASP